MLLKNYIYLILIFVFFGVLSVYFLFVPNLIAEIFAGEAPVWFTHLIHTIYPRFEVEKNRFSLDFFLNKANQVVIRLTLFNSLLFTFLFFYERNNKFRHQINNFFRQKAEKSNLRFLCILFYTGIIFFTAGWYQDYENLQKIAVFYQPISFLKLFGTKFLPIFTFWFLMGLLHFLCLLLIFNVRPFLCSCLAAVLFVFLQAFFYSFEKIDHTYTTLTYASLLMPFLVWEIQFFSEQISKQALLGIQLTLSWAYLQAGLEKLLVSGWQWFQPETLQFHLLTHQAPAGIWLARYGFLCMTLQFLVIAFELGFVLVVFFPKIRYVFIISGVLFHLGTYIFLNVGGWLSPWIFAYIFFVDWQGLDLFLTRKNGENV
ncbi:MAG: hypothetical protein H7Y04_05745 [Verrucomicrobia bacterium]|nr:hypothetical protein [Cytophagales bacterium]